MNLNIITEFLCLLIGLHYWKELRNSFWSLFVPFLSFTLLIETLASFIWKEDNGWLYNSYVQVQFAFFSHFYSKANRSFVHRKVMAVMVFLFVAVSFYEFVFRSPFAVFNLLVFTVDSLFTVVFAILFLLYCINENNIQRISRQSPALWVTLGVVIFFSVAPIVFNAYDFIRSHKLRIAGVYIDNIAPQVLSVIMYGCFAYAFGRWKKIKSSTL